MKKKPTLKINRKSLLRWVFADEPNYTYMILDDLMDHNKFEITTEDIWVGLGYVNPSIVAKDCEVHLDEDGDLDLSKYVGESGLDLDDYEDLPVFIEDQDDK